MDLGRLILTSRVTRSGLVLFALLVAFAFLFAEQSLLLQIGGFGLGLLVLLLVKVAAEQHARGLRLEHQVLMTQKAQAEAEAIIGDVGIRTQPLASRLLAVEDGHRDLAASLAQASSEQLAGLDRLNQRLSEVASSVQQLEETRRLHRLHRSSDSSIRELGLAAALDSLEAHSSAEDNG